MVASFREKVAEVTDSAAAPADGVRKVADQEEVARVLRLRAVLEDALGPAVLGLRRARSRRASSPADVLAVLPSVDASFQNDDLAALHAAVAYVFDRRFGWSEMSGSGRPNTPGTSDASARNGANNGARRGAQCA